MLTVATTFNPEVGDEVRLPDGQLASVVHANPISQIATVVPGGGSKLRVHWVLRERTHERTK